MPTAATAPLLPAPTSAARRLGYLGLVPFVLGALLVWLVHEDAHPYTTLALASYAAVVLSFLGGIHWGLALRQHEPPAALLRWGVLPALVAWPAAMMPPGAGLVILGLALLGTYAIDRRIYPTYGAGAWLTLRFRLSALAALSCFVGAAGS